MKGKNLGKYDLREKHAELSNQALRRWQSEYQESVTGKITVKIIPDLKIVYKNKSWYLNYYITQIITGHGNFGSYLQKYKATTSAECPECKTEDTSFHTILECKKFLKLREEYGIANESDLLLNNKTKCEKILKYFNILGKTKCKTCLLYTSPSPRDRTRSRMPSSA